MRRNISRDQLLTQPHPIPLLIKHHRTPHPQGPAGFVFNFYMFTYLFVCLLLSQNACERVMDGFVEVKGHNFGKLFSPCTMGSRDYTQVARLAAEEALYSEPACRFTLPDFILAIVHNVSISLPNLTHDFYKALSLTCQSYVQSPTGPVKIPGTVRIPHAYSPVWKSGT